MCARVEMQRRSGKEMAKWQERRILGSLSEDLGGCEDHTGGVGSSALKGQAGVDLTLAHRPHQHRAVLHPGNIWGSGEHHAHMAH